MISVLFVDDEPIQLDIGKKFLEKTGIFTVDTSGSAQETLVSKDLMQYDAIVSDYQMPGTDGISLLKQIRSTGNTIPFILFTGRGREETAIQALNDGADFYVRKGVEPDAQFAELGHRIQMAVQRQRETTERLTIENTLRENLERYHQIVKNAPDGILISELIPDGPAKILDANEAACRLLGLSREELHSRCLTDLDIAEVKAVFSNLVRELKQDQHTIFQTTYQTKDGEEKTVKISTCLFEAGGRPIFLSVIHDITEQMKTEQTLRHANKKLRFLSSITRHDIRNQLLALNSYLLLSKDTLNDAEMTAGYIRKEEAITGVIEHQLAFTKLYETLGVNAPVWQNVEQCIRSAVRELDLTGIGLDIRKMDRIEVFADLLLRKVFFNLVDNSLRHGGNALMQIHVSCCIHENGLLIVCEDDGSGIPEGMKEEIFTRGYGKNTGFGLFFIREILSITGITIQECGVPGRGARFEITVPKGAWRPSGKPG